MVCLYWAIFINLIYGEDIPELADFMSCFYYTLKLFVGDITLPNLIMRNDFGRDVMGIN